MKRHTKYKLITGLLAGTVFISSWKLGTIHALASNEKEPAFSISPSEFIEGTIEETQNQQNVEVAEIIIEEHKETLEEFLNNIDDKQIKKFYKQLYDLYDFETFNSRSVIPQYFQTIYGNKFSCGTIQSAGCGISSLAMISSYLFDEIITPDMMTIYDNGPSPASAFEKGIKKLNLNCEIHRGAEAADNLDRALATGHPVIALIGKASIFTDYGHFIVIAGKTPEGKYIVNDPNIENYYQPHLIEGFTNGFTKEQITRGLNGIYIFDTKEEFIDKRNPELSFKIIPSSEKTYTTETNSYTHIKHNDIVITTETTDIKLNPENNSETITTIKPNTELEITAITDNNWLTVKYNNQIRYIPNIKIISILTKAQDLYPELNLSDINPNKIVYLSTTTNLRCGNSLEFEAIGIIDRYETVRVLGEYNDWYFVLTNDYNLGFIPKSNTQEIKDPCIVADKSEQQLYYYKNGERIYSSDSVISSSKEGIYEILTKTNNIIIINPESEWQLSYNQIGEVFNESEVGTKVLLHK